MHQVTPGSRVWIHEPELKHVEKLITGMVCAPKQRLESDGRCSWQSSLLSSRRTSNLVYTSLPNCVSLPLNHAMLQVSKLGIVKANDVVGIGQT